jgi:2'-5' RNA ligase
MRAFIAIDLDTILKTNLAAFIDDLRPLGDDVRWVRLPGMHLTLKFLGEIAEGNVGKIAGLLEKIAGNHPNFNLRLIGTGVFPPGKRAPRVLWIGIAENPQLFALQADVDRQLEILGFEREKRDYHPHLTIGRVKTPSRLEKLLTELAGSGVRSFGEMNVHKLTLFQSLLKPSGAEYRALAEFRLG